jgi:hypothetical protein
MRCLRPRADAERAAGPSRRTQTACEFVTRGTSLRHIIETANGAVSVGRQRCRRETRMRIVCRSSATRESCYPVAPTGGARASDEHFRAQQRLSRAANEPMKILQEAAVPRQPPRVTPRRNPDESHRPGLWMKARENMTSSTSERHRRSRTSKHPRPFTDRCVIVYGDERAPHTRMFPDLAGETVTDQVLWTPARLRARGA